MRTNVKEWCQNFNQMWSDPEAQEEGENCRFTLTKLYF